MICLWNTGTGGTHVGFSVLTISTPRQKNKTKHSKYSLVDNSATMTQQFNRKVVL